MGRFNNTGLHQLRTAFPPHRGWRLSGIGNHGAEVWYYGDYCGLVSMDKTTGKWVATHNVVLNDGDPKYRFDTPQAAALDYYAKVQSAVLAPTLRALDEALG